METKGYVERTIINELSRWDESGRALTSKAVMQSEIPTAIQRICDSTESSIQVTISRAFSRLEDKGLVEKCDPPESKAVDSRKTWWRLTEDGLEEAVRLERGYNDELRKVRRRYGGSWRRTTH